jgi:hypothetical protein
MDAFELPIFDKEPDDVLDYDIDLSEFLPSTDTISTVTPTSAPAGLTFGVTTINNTTKVVKQWISGGTDGDTYTVQIKITTSEGRTKHAHFKIRVKEM